jgi:hypothetical protein
VKLRLYWRHAYLACANKAMWPTAFALKELTAAKEARIGALAKKTVD